MSDKRDGGDDGTWHDPELAAAMRNQKSMSLLVAVTLPPKEFTPPTLPMTAPSETPLTPRTDAIRDELFKKYGPKSDGKSRLLYYMECAESYGQECKLLEMDLAASQSALAESRAECERLRKEVEYAKIEGETYRLNWLEERAFGEPVSTDRAKLAELAVEVASLKISLSKAEAREREAYELAAVTTWAFVMEWCKKRKINPAERNDLFELCGKIRALGERREG